MTDACPSGFSKTSRGIISKARHVMPLMKCLQSSHR
nr:MAG TPA: hypothetical protein [Caudoviricetes sp.]